MAFQTEIDRGVLTITPKREVRLQQVLVIAGNLRQFQEWARSFEAKTGERIVSASRAEASFQTEVARFKYVADANHARGLRPLWLNIGTWEESPALREQGWEVLRAHGWSPEIGDREPANAEMAFA